MTTENLVEGASAGVSTRIESLVLDATPLITQSASALQQYGNHYYTTPGVHAELKDEHSRSQLILWADKLKVRHPKQAYIDKVTSFAKLTGDFAVLSLNDIHIIALAYELEVEANNGNDRLRKYPGEVREEDKKQEKKEYKKYENREENFEEEPLVDDDGFEVVRKKKYNKKKRYQPVSKEAPREVSKEVPKEEPKVEPKEELVTEEPKEEAGAEPQLTEEYDEEDDDGEWITPENLQEELLKDNNEIVQDLNNQNDPSQVVKTVLCTGDFACQNVAMQIGLHLMNTTTGKQIKRVRNYMLRCHACFSLAPIPKDGTPKHFCSRCGGNTLLRCAVSIDKDTGKITPHLKRNFQWITRGSIYSLPSPQSKNQKKLQGNAGYQHNKENRAKALQNPLILREDQKEYGKAIKDDSWQRRQNEKLLQEWIGGGSADNYVSPFTTSQNLKNSSVRVGRGRHANASKGKRK